MKIQFLYYFVWLSVRIIVKVVFRMKVTGHRNIPSRGGFILACNHRSYYDPLLVIAWSLRNVHSFAKAELFRRPVVANLLRRVSAFPVRRGAFDRQALSHATDIIKAGRGLVMFPEGTRCRGGDFLPAKPGIGLVAIHARCPIVPAYLHGSNRLRDCFLGKDRLSIRYGEPIPASELPSEKDSYIAVADEVMMEIKHLSEQQQTGS